VQTLSGLNYQQYAWESFAQRLFYFQGDLDNIQDFFQLDEYLKQLETTLFQGFFTTCRKSRFFSAAEPSLLPGNFSRIIPFHNHLPDLYPLILFNLAG